MTSRSVVCAVLLAVFALPLHAETKPKRAKNVILFLADAAGIPSLNAASWLAYQAPLKLHVQSWPHVGLSDTSPASGFVTDSANGMSSIVTGVKTQNGVISQGPEAVRGKKDGAPTKTILEYAEEHGLKTGVITDEPITDATPAACYAHSNDRGKWGEIFPQALRPRFGDGVDILLGAGRQPIEKQLQAAGSSLDALATQYKRPIYATLEEATAAHLRPIVVADRMDVRAATLRALDELQKSEKGFFLMVEWDAHTNDPKPGLERLIAFDKLAAEVEKRVNLDDTLLLFTADHSFGLRTRGEGNGGSILEGYDEWKASGVKNQPIRLKALLVDDAHTGEEVAAMAIGAGSERVSGFFPNTQLFHVMMDAFGWEADSKAPPSSPAKE
ncbi:MAG: alkaline phosphatase [Vicinamibacteria bacterium]